MIQKQSFWSLGGNGIAALSGLILFALSSSRLTALDFGIWVLFQTGSGLLDMFRVGLLLPGYLQLSAGRSRKNKSALFSSVLYVFVLVTLILVIGCWVLFQVIPYDSPWSFFLLYYPLIILSNATITLSEWWFQSAMRFQSIFFIRGFNRFLIVILAFFLAYDLNNIVHVQIAVNILTSIIIIVFAGVPFVFQRQRDGHYLKLFHFGKYSTPTQTASNLLRSSDTLVISYALGASATGIYGAAAKFLEFVELPIRSLGAVLFNQLAKLSNADKHQEAFNVTSQKIVSTTIRVLPISVLLFFFAPFLVEHISGSNYLPSIPLLRVMAIYCLLIPADRCCGLLLEAYGRPDLNLLKVMVMLGVNLTGDVIAIHFFHSPFAVACSSIITFLLGVGFGFWLIVTKAIPRAQSVNLQMVLDKI